MVKRNLLIPKQDGRICGTICICQMTLVFSCVAIVYLSVAVYMPTLRAVQSKIESPVMCTTIRVDESSNSSSCSEWCLSKGSGTSKNRQIFVHLRENGSTVMFDECVNHDIAHCKDINFETLDPFNCRTNTSMKFNDKTRKNKLVKNNACSNLTGLFHCFNTGVCYNVTDVLDCNSQNETLMRLTCGMTKGKRGKLVQFDCSEVQGVFNCNKGLCSKVDFANCGHDCGEIRTGNKNVVIMSDDQVLTIHCRSAWKENRKIWDSTVENNNLLMVSCLSFNVTKSTNSRESIIMEAIDCVDGVSMKNGEFNVSMNYMNLSLFYNNKTKNDSIVPFVSNLTINKEVKLMINMESCVNTLRDECSEFYRKHSSNGSDHNAVSRFSCFYSQKDNSTAFLHFNIDTEKRNFIFAFFIPSLILIISCFMLILSQKIVFVGDDSKMIFQCYVTDESGKLNANVIEQQKTF